MNSLETLYFPDTAIISTRQSPLALLFSKINLVQAAEDDESADQNPMDSFMNSSICQKLPLHPLGEDKERFLYLINDIKNRKDDYAAQLSHVTLAGLSAKKSQDDESRGQILSSLLGRAPQTSSPSEHAEKDILWQARLVLKLAEILDREEEEVAQALVFLEDSESDVFDQLKGVEDKENDNLYEDMVKITAKLGKPQTQSLARRMHSWFRFINNSTLPVCSIWSTSRQEVADILFENHENKYQREPLHLAAIDLPAHLGKDITVIHEDIVKFKSDSGELLSLIFKMIVAAQITLEEDGSYQEHINKWKQLLEMYYPAKKFGRTQARFYRFAALIHHFSGVDSEDVQGGTELLCVYTT